MPDFPERRRQTAAEGLLVKLNLLQCACGRVYVPPMQASKVLGANEGWFDTLIEVRAMFEAAPNVDPVIRISPGDRGRKVCPNCSGDQMTDNNGVLFEE